MSSLQRSDISSDLIREGYWPGAVERKSCYIFDQQLFQFYDLLQKHNPVPVLSITRVSAFSRHCSDLALRIRSLKRIWIFANSLAVFRNERKGDLHVAMYTLLCLYHFIEWYHQCFYI